MAKPVTFKPAKSSKLAAHQALWGGTSSKTSKGKGSSGKRKGSKGGGGS